MLSTLPLYSPTTRIYSHLHYSYRYNAVKSPFRSYGLYFRTSGLEFHLVLSSYLLAPKRLQMNLLSLCCPLHRSSEDGCKIELQRLSSGRTDEQTEGLAARDRELLVSHSACQSTTKKQEMCPYFKLSANTCRTWKTCCLVLK